MLTLMLLERNALNGYVYTYVCVGMCVWLCMYAYVCMGMYGTSSYGFLLFDNHLGDITARENLFEIFVQTDSHVL